MNFNLPIFGFKPKKNERYSTIYLYDSITKSLPQDNTKISIYNFLLFLTYIPYQSMMSDITEKSNIITKHFLYIMMAKIINYYLK